MPKAYSYRRFSTPEQMKGDSMRRQLELAESYANRHGLDLDQELSFDDPGLSAYRGLNIESGHLGQFLYAAQSGLVEPGSYLLVENLDRLSRATPRKALRVLEDICDHGVTVVTLSDERKYTAESLDDDPMALLISILTFMRANEESALKSRRLKAAWENKRANARDKPLTARAPAWLRLDREKGVFDVLEDRAQIVRDIYRWTLEGTGQHSITERLNRGGVPVFGRGKQWHRSYIAKLLKSEAVIGTYTPHTQEYKDGRKVRIPQEPVQGYYPAVVSEESFRRVQSLSRFSQAPRRGRHAKAPVQNLFGGLAKCPKCDATMTLVNKGKRSKPYLICTTAKVGAGCVYRGVKYEPVEKAFLNGWQRVAVDFPAGDPALDAEVHAKSASAEATQDAITNLLEALEAGGDSPALMKRLRHLEDSLEELEKELGELGRQQVAVAGRITESKALDLEKALVEEPLDRAKVNALLRQVFEKVVVDYDSGELEFCWQQGGSVGSVMFAWPFLND